MSTAPSSADARDQIVAAPLRDLIAWVGDDPTREGLRETPARVAAAWREWCSGYGKDVADVLKTFEDGSENYHDLVFEGGIPFYSQCEHHMCPFFGIAHIGYIPNGRIVGLSKLSRVTDIFARRLQVQERLTRQIAEALNEHLKPQAVGVVLRCRHLCMESRGINKPGAFAYTSALLGKFMSEPETRAEFLSFVTRADSLSVL